MQMRIAINISRHMCSVYSDKSVTKAQVNKTISPKSILSDAGLLFLIIIYLKVTHGPCDLTYPTKWSGAWLERYSALKRKVFQGFKAPPE